MNQECECCQHRDAVYLADIDYGRIVALCATCIKIFKDAVIIVEADTRSI